MSKTLVRCSNLAAVVLAVALASCLTRPLVKVEPVTESKVTESMKQVQFSGVDILVIVDNSKSMKEEQENLAAEFPNLIQSLLNPPDHDGDTVPDHVPVKDLHIGVVSTDMGTGGYTVETCADPTDGDDGVLQHDPNPLVSGCEASYPTFLSYESEEPDPGAIGYMATGFGCIATLGTDGCGFEQQLKAANRAVEHTAAGGPNAGFLRPDSILTILFVTDEEDCSVADPAIFDTANAALGHLNLRCFLNPTMVQPVQQYIDAFRGYRTAEDKLVLAFIVGVPPGGECEGFGNEIPTCLEHPDMQEMVDPVENTRLRYSCETANGAAFPPRRFVQIAQAFGPNALVRSICTDDFQPAIDGLTSKLHEVVDSVQVVRDLETEVVEGTCNCEATCTILEELPDMRACDPGKECYDPEDDGICNTEVDAGGQEHRMCEIPQAGTTMSPCDPANPPACNDPSVTHSVTGSGWYYVGRGWSLDGTIIEEGALNFTEGMTPTESADVYIQCNSLVCPEERQCGTLDNPTAFCCEENEFCACDPYDPATTCSSADCQPRPE
jgi:hypothetical protein